MSSTSSPIAETLITFCFEVLSVLPHFLPPRVSRALPPPKGGGARQARSLVG